MAAPVVAPVEVQVAAPAEAPVAVRVAAPVAVPVEVPAVAPVAVQVAVPVAVRVEVPAAAPPLAVLFRIFLAVSVTGQKSVRFVMEEAECRIIPGDRAAAAG